MKLVRRALVLMAIVVPAAGCDGTESGGLGVTQDPDAGGAADSPPPIDTTVLPLPPGAGLVDALPVDPPPSPDAPPADAHVADAVVAAVDPFIEGAAPVAIPGACDIALSEIAIYQGVKISLGNAGKPAAPGTDVVWGRTALLRAFVQPSASWAAGREAEAHLLLSGTGGKIVLRDRKMINQASTDGALTSTFNFEIPAATLTGDVHFSVAIVGPAKCTEAPSRARFPAAGDAALSPRRTGTLKVRLVPIRYEADGSGRLPSVTTAQLERYRTQLMSIYPVAGVELSLRDAVGSDTALGTDGWPTLLDALRHLRADDAPPPNVYYYGLVAPATSFSAYCKGSCTAGLSYLARMADPAQHVGVGVGFSGQTSAETFAHEIGHGHGRAHAPCGNAASIDENFPYSNGGTGAWGYDIAAHQLFDPATYRDLMGYCHPSWVSDYNYRALVEWSAGVNDVSTQARVAQAAAARPPGSWRVLLVDAKGNTRWGLPLGAAESPSGALEQASVRDANGNLLENVNVFRTEITDGGGAMLMVPAARDGRWHAIEVLGARPHLFGTPVTVRTLKNVAPELPLNLGQ